MADSRRYPKKKTQAPPPATRRNRLFRFPFDLDNAIYAVAEAQGISMNEFVSAWLREHPDIRAALAARRPPQE